MKKATGQNSNEAAKATQAEVVKTDKVENLILSLEIPIQKWKNSTLLSTNVGSWTKPKKNLTGFQPGAGRALFS